MRQKHWIRLIAVFLSSLLITGIPLSALSQDNNPDDGTATFDRKALSTKETAPTKQAKKSRATYHGSRPEVTEELRRRGYSGGSDSDKNRTLRRGAISVSRTTKSATGTHTQLRTTKSSPEFSLPRPHPTDSSESGTIGATFDKTLVPHFNPGRGISLLLELIESGRLAPLVGDIDGLTKLLPFKGAPKKQSYLFTMQKYQAIWEQIITALMIFDAAKEFSPEDCYKLCLKIEGATGVHQRRLEHPEKYQFAPEIEEGEIQEVIDCSETYSKVITLTNRSRARQHKTTSIICTFNQDSTLCQSAFTTPVEKLPECTHLDFSQYSCITLDRLPLEVWPAFQTAALENLKEEITGLTTWSSEGAHDALSRFFWLLKFVGIYHDDDSEIMFAITQLVLLTYGQDPMVCPTLSCFSGSVTVASIKSVIASGVTTFRSDTQTVHGSSLSPEFYLPVLTNMQQTLLSRLKRPSEDVTYLELNNIQFDSAQTSSEKGDEDEGIICEEPTEEPLQHEHHERGEEDSPSLNCDIKTPFRLDPPSAPSTKKTPPEQRKLKSDSGIELLPQDHRAVSTPSLID
ncbi:hypothetical protein ACWJJH_01380 [Endozoicomonadaceae bacterium StTr2]